MKEIVCRGCTETCEHAGTEGQTSVGKDCIPAKLAGGNSKARKQAEILARNSREAAQLARATAHLPA